ncbi:MAG: L-serine ammonia-lyase, iron-sulfur-dependent, subunit alpha [Atopobiaceae bacterium]|jgi:L-serine dehydratase|nr:L-serine ammonia-lyase, iron-sulfur-dependent, subunit alpha [Atopobiaceae bacterium]MCI2173354.1 L-serine ammonia-lyase, iron-sulfur-dependent, subunit alpha [Atopobiaceae bacterium]MCI2207349.1 L-serine ammonia-lyase, iron-sulfur-dependent, subunit alpha [Atopobiaceae bacterium]
MRTSAFEILGPIMVGPSSSHTAGALRIAQVARQVAPRPIKLVTFTLYNSFARTYEGHGTGRALVAGILGLAADDVRIKDSFDLSEQAGLAFSFVEAPDGTGKHPNTVDIDMTLDDGERLSVMGESLGGGRVRVCEINGVAVEVTGELNTLFVSHQDVPGVLAALTGMISAADINIATVHTYRKERGGDAYSVFEVDEPLEDAFVERVSSLPGVRFASVVLVPGAPPAATAEEVTYDFDTGSALLGLCESAPCSIGTAMRRREAQITGSEEAVGAEMHRVLEVMRSETVATIERPERSLGGYLFGQAAAVDSRGGSIGPSLLGPTLTKAVAYAMATLERSATMGVIVAAPTAGSAGVVPGALLALGEAMGAPDEKVEQGLWCAAAVGALIATNGSVSGAEGGCQAEVGTASAMAAAGLTQMMFGSPRACLTAAALAMANVLGMVCDPVRGLVEYPCQDRNALGVSNAFTAAQLALSGVGSVIPFDEVVDAMTSVGHALPPSLRETALGGLAAEPSACRGCTGCE